MWGAVRVCPGPGKAARGSRDTSRFRLPASEDVMGEGLFQPLHLLLIVAIALLLFGPSKFADLGKGLGEGIRNFKAAVKDKDDKDSEKKS